MDYRLDLFDILDLLELLWLQNITLDKVDVLELGEVRMLGFHQLSRSISHANDPQRRI